MPKATNQPPFVDESRIKLVDGLLDITDTINEIGEARWVALEAPSGWGKTRVAQELYARLAARQTQLYWPATILESSAEEWVNVAGRRKRVFPDPTRFNRAAGALPEFMWWGIACDKRTDGRPSQALLEDLQQLESHSVHLEAATSALRAFYEGHFSSLQLARKMLGEVVEEAAGEGLEKVVELIAKSSVPGLGIFVTLTKWGFGKTKQTFANRKQVLSAGSLDSVDNYDLVSDTVNLFSRLARPGLPCIVFVEDLHNASPTTEQLIERLVRTNASILIVTTSWPGDLDRLDKLGKLCEDDTVCGRIYRVEHDRSPPEIFPNGASLAELSQSSLESIVLSYYPKADPVTLSKLSQRYPNPLALELVCVLPKYRSQFTDGHLKLTSEEIERIPRTVRDLYSALWDTESLDVQQALALATLSIPDRDTTWYNPLTQKVISALDSLDSSDLVAKALDNEQFPRDWARVIETRLRQFNEPDQFVVAQEAVEENFSTEIIDQFIDKLVELVTTEELDSTDLESQHLAWLVYSLHKKGKVPDEQMLKAVLLLQDALEDSPIDYPVLNELGEYLEKLNLKNDSKEYLKAQLNFNTTLGSSGQIDEALKQSQALLADCERVLGVDHPNTLTARSNIASWLGESGHIDEALKESQVLLADRKRILGADHPSTLGTRNNIASGLAQSGRVDEALKQFHTLLADEERVLGADHPDTLTTRNNIAGWLGASGQIDEALKQFHTLLADEERVLGADHPLTLTARNNIASELAQSGHTDEALIQFHTLLVDRERVLGTDHPDTLTTRYNIASWLGKSGHIDEALNQFQALLVDRERLLGSDHPDTLDTRHNISFYLGDSGRIDEALKQFHTLLANQEFVLGADHPDTLKTRNNIAGWLGESGQIDEALKQFHTLLADEERVLGADHPVTLTTRNNIAFWLGKSGKIDEALKQFHILLADQQRVLDVDHPDTLKTRNNIAFWLEESGQIDEALKQSRALLAELERVLGVDHPGTLTTRNNIAGWLGKSGQIDEALKQFHTLLADQQRVLGADHPDTLRTRNNIAFYQEK